MDEQNLEKVELFNSWNEQKQRLDSNRRRLLFKEGEIWWCSLGINVGEEVYGKGAEFSRILKKLTDNSCIVLPLTSKTRSGNWYHHLFLNNKDRWVMMHQIRSISANRLTEREATIFPEDLNELKKSVALLLGLS